MSEHLLAFAIADRWLWTADFTVGRKSAEVSIEDCAAFISAPNKPASELTNEPVAEASTLPIESPQSVPTPAPASLSELHRTEQKLSVDSAHSEALGPPPHPPAPHQLWSAASDHFESRSPEEALQLYRQIVNEAGSASEKALAAHNCGLCLWQLGRYNEAATAFESAMQADETLTDAALALAWCHLHMRKPESALAGFDQYLNLNPSDRPTQRGRAQALQMMSQGKAAYEAYQQFSEEEQNNPDLLANLIALAAEQQNIAALNRYSGQLLHLRPRSRQALAGIATAELTTGNYDAGLEHIQEFLRIEPKSFEAWFNAGLAADLSGATETAVQAYQRAQSLAPSRWEPILNQGAMHLEQGDLAAAADHFQAVLEADPRNITALWNLSLLAERQNDLQRAEDYAQRLLDDDPSKTEVLLHIGYLRFRNRDWTGSIQALQTCLVHRLNWLEARLFLALACWNAGDQEGATTQLDLALRHDPIFVPALQCRLVLALHRHDAGVAPELEAQLADLGHTNPEFCYNVGVLLQTNGSFEEAIVAYRRAVGKRPAFAEALINLGHALEAVGKHDEAREAWQKAISAQPELTKKYFGVLA